MKKGETSRGKLQHPEIFMISVLDVNNLLPFSKQEGEDLGETIKEMERVYTELTNFRAILEKHLRRKLIDFDEERMENKHVVRFFFDGHEGLMEVIIERPTTLSASFVREKDATQFLHALKATMHELLKPSPVRDLFIESLHVAKGDQERIAFEKHSTMRNIYLHHGISVVLISVFIFVMMQVIQEVIEAISNATIHQSMLNQYLFGIGIAVVIAIFFQPIQKFIEGLIEKIL